MWIIQALFSIVRNVMNNILYILPYHLYPTSFIMKLATPVERVGKCYELKQKTMAVTSLTSIVDLALSLDNEQTNFNADVCVFQH